MTNLVDSLALKLYSGPVITQTKPVGPTQFSEHIERTFLTKIHCAHRDFSRERIKNNIAESRTNVVMNIYPPPCNESSFVYLRSLM